MLEIVITVLYTAVVIIALLLIALVLVQPSKSGGFGSTFGGVGEAVFGAQATNHLSKLTVILTAVFFILTLLLTALSGHVAGTRKTIAAVDHNLLADIRKDAAADNRQTVKSVSNVQKNSAVAVEKSAAVSAGKKIVKSTVDKKKTTGKVDR